MKENKSLSLKIPSKPHSILKAFAAKKDISLIKLAENLLVEAIENQELLEKASKLTEK